MYTVYTSNIHQLHYFTLRDITSHDITLHYITHHNIAYSVHNTCATLSVVQSMAHDTGGIDLHVNSFYLAINASWELFTGRWQRQQYGFWKGLPTTRVQFLLTWSSSVRWVRV